MNIIKQMDETRLELDRMAEGAYTHRVTLQSPREGEHEHSEDRTIRISCRWGQVYVFYIVGIPRQHGAWDDRIPTKPQPVHASGRTIFAALEEYRKNLAKEVKRLQLAVASFR